MSQRVRMGQRNVFRCPQDFQCIGAGTKRFSGNAMDSYIVRIYRRSGRKSRILIGTVEVAGTEKKMAFSSAEELWCILSHPRRKGEAEYRTVLERM